MKDIEKLQNRNEKVEIIEPMGRYLLVRKDPDKDITSGGIILPDSSRIPVITGRVLEVSKELEGEIPIERYDRIIIIPNQSVRVEFESENYLVPVESVIGRISSERT